MLNIVTRWQNKQFKDNYRKEQYRFIKDFLAQIGYELLSREYIKNSVKLEVRCKNGHIFFRSWMNLRLSYNCPNCSSKESSKKRNTHIVLDGEEYKRCGICKEYKKLDNFFTQSIKWDKKSVMCRQCKHAYIKRWSLNNSDNAKNIKLRSHFKNNYNITLEDYNTMVSEQNGLCKICRGKDKNKRLYIDHCHRSGKIRGLLCNNCNSSIASMKENIFLLDYMIYYLKNYKNFLPNDTQIERNKVLDKKERLLNSSIKSNFGIDFFYYSEMLNNQGHTCFICGNSNGGRRLAIDHDHITLQVRGLLCTSCNSALGRFKDNELIIKNAIKYLTESKIDVSIKDRE